MMADEGKGGIRFGTTQKGRRKLIDENGYYYTLKNVRKRGRVTEYWRCALSNCPGRFIYYPERRGDVIGEGKLTVPHLEEERINPQWRAKEAAMERLKQLTVAGKTVKVADLVKKVLREMPSDARHLMGAEDYLRRKVKFWAKLGDIQIVPSSTEAYLSGGDLAQDDAGPSGSGNETADITQSLRGQKSKQIPEDKKLGLLVLKSRTEDGRFKYMIDGHIFHWYQEGKDATEYQCWETNNGCPVKATVYEDKQYEVKGEHIHDIDKLKPKQGGRRWVCGLKRVDDDGIVLGPVSVKDMGVFKGETSQHQYIPPPSIPKTKQVQESEVASNADDDAMDDGYDFHADSAPEPEENEAFTVSPKVTKKLSRPKDAVKSGERCHVCGDVLLVSETLSTSAETFRKACRYLNIKSDKEWFPDAPNSRFYTFCDSCTREITKIHELYKKVEEIQSLIFTKVENVEKRIADAEIVDNWMADAPPSSAVRFESFRKQVLINYKNKLKLRREIRVGRKMGHAFVEVQPGTSANMFASNPTETDAFRKLLPTVSSSLTSIRTRSKSKQKESQCAGNVKDEATHSAMDDNFSSHENDGGHHNLEDFPDSCSETSEKETKFWHEDSDKLLVKQGTISQRSLKEGHDNMDDEGGDSMFQHNQDEESDPDNDTNEDISCRDRTLHQRKSTSGKVPSNNTQHSLNSTPKSRGRSHIMDVEIPDAILTNDNRMFLEGVEILKLPPGSYQQKPESEAYSCGSCGIIMLKFWSIRLHICGQHLGMFRCPICDKKFAEPKVIRRHIETQHTERQAKSCEVCLRPMCGDEKAMNYHRWTHLSEEEKNDPKYLRYRPYKVRPLRKSKIEYSFTQSFQCCQCGKTFPRANLLKKHEMTHSEIQMKVQCQYCGKFYAHQYSLTSHIKICPAQEKLARRLFSCRHCPVSFIDRTSLAKHLLRKHGESKPKPFSCFKCSKQFITKHKHRNHQRVCTGSAPKPRKKREPRKVVATSNRRSRSRKAKVPTDSSQPSSSADVNEIRPSVDVKIDPSAEPQANQEYSTSNGPSVSGYNYGMYTGMFSHQQ